MGQEKKLHLTELRGKKRSVSRNRQKAPAGAENHLLRKGDRKKKKDLNPIREIRKQGQKKKQGRPSNLT